MSSSDWGGSEVLWCRAADELLARGHEVFARTAQRKMLSPSLLLLQNSGAQLSFYRRCRWMGRGLRRRLRSTHLGNCRHHAWLKYARPDLVLISCSYHLDDVSLGNACRRLGIPYAILLQAAGRYQFIDPRDVAFVREVYSHADQLYFVSSDNRDILEDNLELDLSAAQIVDNAFQISVDANPPWPGELAAWRFACVGRLSYAVKGQDILLRVLRQDKWRMRPLEVVLWGDDHGSRSIIEASISQFGLQSTVRLGGFTSDIEQMWSQHHALILPSRFEGNALAMIEAMLCAPFTDCDECWRRPAIGR